MRTHALGLSFDQIALNVQPCANWIGVTNLPFLQTIRSNPSSSHLRFLCEANLNGLIFLKAKHSFVAAYAGTTNWSQCLCHSFSRESFQWRIQAYQCLNATESTITIKIFGYSDKTNLGNTSNGSRHYFNQINMTVIYDMFVQRISRQSSKYFHLHELVFYKGKLYLPTTGSKLLLFSRYV